MSRALYVLASIKSHHSDYEEIFKKIRKNEKFVCGTKRRIRPIFFLDFVFCVPQNTNKIAELNMRRIENLFEVPKLDQSIGLRRIRPICFF